MQWLSRWPRAPSNLAEHVTGMSKFQFNIVGGYEEGELDPNDADDTLRAMQARPMWEGVCVTPQEDLGDDGACQFPFLNISWHAEHGYELQCFETPQSNSDFLSAEQILGAPQVYVELGGQTQELWPRQLFVPFALAVQALRFFLESGRQVPSLHWVAIDRFPRRTVRPRHLLTSRTIVLGLLLGLLFGPLAAAQSEKVRRVGFLSAPTPSPAMIDAFREGLRENGYVEGRNVLIEWRSADGKAERLSGLANELVGLKVEVIVTFASQATLAAMKATTTLPIVFTQVGDPVASGIVTSLARPSANVTGLTNFIVDLTRKRLELTRQAVPALKSVAILTDPTDPLSASYLKESEIAARELGLDVRAVEVRHPAELGPAFTAIVQSRTQAVVLAPGPFIFTHRTQIASLAARARVPVVGWDRELAESGALISYGPDRFKMLRRAGVYADKILKGAKPADLPVEGPTQFELVVNLKTAKALGLTIPQSILFRADNVMK